MSKRSRKKSRRKKLPIVSLVGTLLLILACGGLTYYLVKKNSKGGSDKNDSSERVESSNPQDPQKISRDLKAVLEATDKKNPGWRLRDMAAKRAKIDAVSNGAKVVLDVGQQLPDGWAAGVNSSQRHTPVASLPANELGLYRNLVSRHSKPLAEARRIAEYRRGIYPI